MANLLDKILGHYKWYQNKPDLYYIMTKGYCIMGPFRANHGPQIYI